MVQKIKDSEKWEYFNPLEWKKSEFVFGQLDQQYFLAEEDAKYYVKQHEIESNKKENKKK